MKDVLYVMKEVMNQIIIAKNVRKMIKIIIFIIFFMMKKENALMKLKNL